MIDVDPWVCKSIVEEISVDLQELTRLFKQQLSKTTLIIMTTTEVWLMARWIFQSVVTTVLSGLSFVILVMVLEYAKKYRREQREKENARFFSEMLRKKGLTEIVDADGKRQLVSLFSMKGRGENLFQAYKNSGEFLGIKKSPDQSLGSGSFSSFASPYIRDVAAKPIIPLKDFTNHQRFSNDENKTRVHSLAIEDVDSRSQSQSQLHGWITDRKLWSEYQTPIHNSKPQQVSMATKKTLTRKTSPRHLFRHAALQKGVLASQKSPSKSAISGKIGDSWQSSTREMNKWQRDLPPRSPLLNSRSIQLKKETYHSHGDDTYLPSHGSTNVSDEASPYLSPSSSSQIRQVKREPKPSQSANDAHQIPSSQIPRLSSRLSHSKKETKRNQNFIVRSKEKEVKPASSPFSKCRLRKSQTDFSEYGSPTPFVSDKYGSQNKKHHYNEESISPAREERSFTSVNDLQVTPLAARKLPMWGFRKRITSETPTFVSVKSDMVNMDVASDANQSKKAPRPVKHLDIKPPSAAQALKTEPKTNIELKFKEKRKLRHRSSSLRSKKGFPDKGLKKGAVKDVGLPTSSSAKEVERTKQNSTKTGQRVRSTTTKEGDEVQSISTKSGDGASSKVFKDGRRARSISKKRSERTRSTSSRISDQTRLFASKETVTRKVIPYSASAQSEKTLKKANKKIKTLPAKNPQDKINKNTKEAYLKRPSPKPYEENQKEPLPMIHWENQKKPSPQPHGEIQKKHSTVFVNSSVLTLSDKKTEEPMISSRITPRENLQKSVSSRDALANKEAANLLALRSSEQISCEIITTMDVMKLLASESTEDPFRFKPIAATPENEKTFEAPSNSYLNNDDNSGYRVENSFVKMHNLQHGNDGSNEELTWLSKPSPVEEDALSTFQFDGNIFTKNLPECGTQTGEFGASHHCFSRESLHIIKSAPLSVKLPSPQSQHSPQVKPSPTEKTSLVPSTPWSLDLSKVSSVPSLEPSPNPSDEFGHQWTNEPFVLRKSRLDDVVRAVQSESSHQEQRLVHRDWLSHQQTQNSTSPFDSKLPEVPCAADISIATEGTAVMKDLVIATVGVQEAADTRNSPGGDDPNFTGQQKKIIDTQAPLASNSKWNTLKQNYFEGIEEKSIGDASHHNSLDIFGSNASFVANDFSSIGAKEIPLLDEADSANMVLHFGRKAFSEYR